MSGGVVKRILGIIGAVGVLVGAALLVTLATSTAGKSEYTATFDKVTGLVVLAEINQSGAKVGEVKSIDVSDDGYKAELVLAIDPDLKIRRDAKIQLKVKSLLGELYLDLDPGVSGEVIAPGGEITNTGTDMTLDDLLFNVSGLLGDVSDSKQVKRLIDELNTAFQGRGQDMEVVLDNSQILVSNLADNADTLNSVVASMDQLTSALDGRTDALSGVVSKSAQQLEQLRTTLVQNEQTVRSTLDTLKRTLAQVNDEEINKQLATIPSWLGKIDKVLVQLDDLVNHRQTIAATFVSLPDSNKEFDEFLRTSAQNPLLREWLISLLEPLTQGERPPRKPPQAPGSGPNN
jgi:phospholipid/cholesterol/gamma-HCH transport system substrate-binding protein